MAIAEAPSRTRRTGKRLVLTAEEQARLRARQMRSEIIAMIGFCAVLIAVFVMRGI